MKTSKVNTISLKEEMIKNPELTKTDLNHLMEWNRNAQHLPNLSAETLVLFLHSCYWDLEKTKTTIDIHYTIRSFAPEFFSMWDPCAENIQNIMSINEIAILPRRDAEGNKMILMRMTDTDPNHMQLDNSMRFFVMICLVTLYIEGTCPGFVFIVDMAGTTFRHVLKMCLSLARKFAYYMQDAQPVRMKHIYVINSGVIIDKGFSLVKPFISAGIVKLITFHSSAIQYFYKYVPQALLPADYGGELGNMKDMHESVKSLVITHRDWFLVEEQLKSDETKRAGGPKTSAKVFGFGE